MTPITAWTFLQLALLCYYFRRPTLRCVAPHRPVDLLPVRPGNRISRFGNRSLMEISAPRSRCSTAKSRVQTDRDELCGCGNSKAAIQIMAMESTVRLRSILLLLLPRHLDCSILVCAEYILHVGSYTVECRYVFLYIRTKRRHPSELQPVRSPWFCADARESGRSRRADDL